MEGGSAGLHRYLGVGLILLGIVLVVLMTLVIGKSGFGGHSTELLVIGYIFCGLGILIWYKTRRTAGRARKDERSGDL